MVRGNKMKLTAKKIASMIDQTLLSPTASEEKVRAFIGEASSYGFASVCINPVYVPLAAKMLAGTKTKVCTVIDFPLGAGGTKCKIAESREAIKAGAQEVDFVVDIALVRSHDWSRLQKELTRVIDAMRPHEVTSKLILETCYLTDEEITQSSVCAKNAGFDFVKTSTGFATPKDDSGKALPNGATVHAVELMRRAVGKKMGVKASGGIHSAKDAIALIEAGATRIGASAGVEIVNGAAELN